MLSPEALLALNLTNDTPGKGTLWTRVNVGEATPGTVTPLTAEFQRPSNTFPAGRMFHRMGILPTPEIPGNQDPRAALTRFFFGKIAISVDFLRWISDRTPGTSGDEFEASILGSVREGVTSKPDHSRLPIALTKLIYLFKVMPAENARLGRETSAWWRDFLKRVAVADLQQAAVLLDEACKRYERIIDHAGLMAMLSPAVMSQLAPAVQKVGTQEDLLKIAAGYGALKEADMLEKLWAVAKGRMRMSMFLDEYGYMCPGGGELESFAWREDLASLQPLLDAYAQQGRGESPRAKREHAAAVATAKQAELIGRARGATRMQLQLGLWLAARMLPLREVGKACMFMGCDAGRAAARRIGYLLAEQGILADAEDVFYLSFDEIKQGATLSRSVRDAVAERRALRAAYDEIEMPDFFTSEQVQEIAWRHVKEKRIAAEQPVAVAGASAVVTESFTIEAAAASAGRVTGTARVIRDPRAPGAFKRGDILICQVTDPGWSALFSIAGALIADVGGMLSHSAIIARELGIPAVVNTRNGTKRIPDGATITVDGAAGLIIVHASGVDVLKTA